MGNTNMCSSEKEYRNEQNNKPQYRGNQQPTNYTKPPDFLVNNSKWRDNSQLRNTYGEIQQVMKETLSKANNVCLIEKGFWDSFQEIESTVNEFPLSQNYHSHRNMICNRCIEYARQQIRKVREMMEFYRKEQSKIIQSKALAKANEECVIEQNFWANRNVTTYEGFRKESNWNFNYQYHKENANYCEKCFNIAQKSQQDITELYQ